MNNPSWTIGLICGFIVAAILFCGIIIVAWPEDNEMSSISTREFELMINRDPVRTGHNTKVYPAYVVIHRDDILCVIGEAEWKSCCIIIPGPMWLHVKASKEDVLNWWTKGSWEKNNGKED